jgi:predicted RNase H-like nuclease
MNGSSIELFNKLVNDLKGCTDIEPCIQSIKTLLDDIEGLRQQVQECHCATLQCHGVGKELRQVELTAGRVTSVTKALEDILMHAMDDLHSLFHHYARGELLYQKFPGFASL